MDANPRRGQSEAATGGLRGARSPLQRHLPLAPSTPDQAALLASTENQIFSAHDETATCGLVLASWYGSGLQAFARKGGRSAPRVSSFVPTPLSSVQAENPDILGVTMHSQPMISGGLIYVVDIRNGLYVLSYRGPHHREVSGAGYLSGNSNLTQGGRSLPVNRADVPSKPQFISASMIERPSAIGSPGCG